MKKKLLSIICIVALMSCSLLFTGCGSEVTYSDVRDKTESYIMETLTEPGYGDEWKILGLSRAEAAAEDGYYDGYYSRLEEAVKAQKGELNARKYTEYSRVIVTLSAIGKDPSDVGGYNLLEKLADFEKVKMQGINGPIWALIALDSRDYQIPQVSGVATQTTRALLIEEILSQEVSGGGFGFSNGVADCDLTAMAIQALAPYAESDEIVKGAVDRGIAALENCEMISSESLSQVIVALCAVGVDAESYVNTLLTYGNDEGGLCHTYESMDEKKSSDSIATEQAFYALVAYDRYMNGQNRLYDMN